MPCAVMSQEKRRKYAETPALLKAHGNSASRCVGEITVETGTALFAHSVKEYMHACRLNKAGCNAVAGLVMDNQVILQTEEYS
eukprot:4796858-Pyramimonas_sp.AAC.1